ncbi:class I SAM-dependent methyltransferase [Amycolatopsis taiwanensis]|uniref:class I SAM-dependent methyltransferase n=1 Tax=Amycolatopsis taiwanensis TaxID=342230 RepID=UPI001FE06C99|nr:class I SAM-dependent methyltransferase [Amycolatopsis taiwanensis]
MAGRAKAFDTWITEFLAANPDATVAHLGCGMDSRVYRLDPPPTVRWFDVDYPDVIDLRGRIYPDRDEYTQIGSSITDLTWLERLPWCQTGRSGYRRLCVARERDLLCRTVQVVRTRAASAQRRRTAYSPLNRHRQSSRSRH